MSILRSNCTNGVVRSRGMETRSAQRRKVFFLDTGLINLFFTSKEAERSAERRKVNALEMKCLRSLVGV